MPPQRRDRARSPARLPLALLGLIVMASAGAALWASYTGPPPAATPAADVALVAPAPATPAAPAAEVATPPDSVPAQPASLAPAPPPGGGAPGGGAPGEGTPGEGAPAAATAEPPAMTPPAAAPTNPEAAVPEPPAEAPPPPPPEPPAAAPGPPPKPQAAATPPTPQPPAPQVASLPAETPPPPPAYHPPPLTGSGGLAPAPDPALVQSTPAGPLPVIAPDGRRAWQVYARPFDPADKRPRIAILIAGLGPSSAATETAIQGLPGGVSLAFWPYADQIDRWMRLARAAGHEVLLNLPMEPDNYPDFDPGPQTLLTSLTPQQNLARLDWALSRVTGYVGVADYLGSRFTASRRDVTPVLEAIRRRGLVFVDSRVTAHSVAPEIAQRIGLPWAASTRFLDEPQVSRDAIDAKLRELESIARVQHVALGIGAPYPVTLERIAAWADGLEDKGFALAPVTAIVAPSGMASARNGR